MDKKNTMLLTVIAVATLLVAVVGATFAYFTASNSASGSTTATVTTEAVGAVVVTNETPALKMNLTAVQTGESAKNSTYWATAGDGQFVTSAEHAPIASMTATGGTANTSYACSFDIKVTKDTNFKANDATVIFTLDGATMTDVTSAEEIDYVSLKDRYTVTFTQVGDTTAAKDLVKVAVAYNNVDGEQNYLAGKTLSTTFEIDADSMTCKVN